MRCSWPGCGRLTTAPWDDPSKAVNVGVAAHISAAASGGPRHDPDMTPEQRRSPENGTWLCQNHAKLVDNDTDRNPAQVLREWKLAAEDAARQEVEGGCRAPASPPGAGAILVRAPLPCHRSAHHPDVRTFWATTPPRTAWGISRPMSSGESGRRLPKSPPPFLPGCFRGFQASSRMPMRVSRGRSQPA